MVPELERMAAFLGARLVPAEVADSLGEVLSEPPDSLSWLCKARRRWMPGATPSS